MCFLFMAGLFACSQSRINMFFSFDLSGLKFEHKLKLPWALKEKTSFSVNSVQFQGRIPLKHLLPLRQVVLKQFQMKTDHINL